MKTKRGCQRLTVAQLESELENSQRDAGVLHQVLNDVLNGQVKWFRRGNIRLGISRETGAAGGHVIVRELNKGHKAYACAYLWERWFPAIRDHYSTVNEDLRLCALDAGEWINKQQRADGFLPWEVPAATKHDLTPV